MTRVMAVHAAVLGLLLPPLALSGPTAWLLLPVHAVFSTLVAVGAVLAGWSGHPESARRWGLSYLVATAGMVGALELGAEARGAGWLYWGGPWLGALVWGWIPPLLAGGAGWIGDWRERRLVGRAVALRRQRR